MLSATDLRSSGSGVPHYIHTVAGTIPSGRPKCYISRHWLWLSLRGCLYGGEPALLVGLVPARGLNVVLMCSLIFSSLLRRTDTSERVYMENSQPYCYINDNKFYKRFHREARPRRKEPALRGGLARFLVNTTLKYKIHFWHSNVFL